MITRRLVPILACLFLSACASETERTTEGSSVDGCGKITYGQTTTIDGAAIVDLIGIGAGLAGKPLRAPEKAPKPFTMEGATVLCPEGRSCVRHERKADGSETCTAVF